ncbi:MAG: 3-dehydroquinate synthase [Solibacteraceae bacterium]|nr:3-dehydroquinate synthase [Solibacteraceae bacterium]
MPAFAVSTPAQSYEAIVERGALRRLREYVPARAGKVFVVTTEDVWQWHGDLLTEGMAGREFELIFFPGGEERKRMASVEAMAERMVERGGDRSSVVIAFGGGIVNDLGGFLAAIFMRGVPVIQIPTTLLAQVDAAVGGKTGANLNAGKNLVGAFHQPLAVLTDPDVLTTLPEREYRAGIQEVVKCGIIRSPGLFELMHTCSRDVLTRDPEVVERMIAESVRIKCEVVTADEREGGLRRILNFGHTIGHALEAETGYRHFLHGEAVGVGMIAAAHLSHLAGSLGSAARDEIIETVERYGPFPDRAGIGVEALMGRLDKDKKAVQGAVHFVLATRIGETEVVAGIEPAAVREAIRLALR